jgi:hypothetical protein
MGLVDLEQNGHKKKKKKRTQLITYRIGMVLKMLNYDNGALVAPHSLKTFMKA